MTTTHQLNREEAKKLREIANAMDTAEIISEAPEIQMAQQLTEQYDRATGGMIEVLKFGAMMMQLRDSIVSARGHVATGGAVAKDTGIKAWLEEHCPKINRQTAYRLEAVTKSVQDEYTAIVGSKVAKQFSLPSLVMTPAEQLPESAQQKQMELFDFVKGTSQRSWLDKLTPVAERGGKTYDRGGGKGSQVQPTMDQKAAALKSLCSGTAASLKTLHDSNAWVVLNDAENDGLIDHLEEVLKGARGWRKLSQADREKALTEALR